ncbi:5-formyltetrahydrofolate cyclo-ligase [hydrothermal vent metagenome]|uniref:5-formyltetrahydrofolate cyclo-ligase n=1 Tax=hydrothermal vent metagenome TaxID=652676 RepID=A0A3B0T6J2_9ZZZZ
MTPIRKSADKTERRVIARARRATLLPLRADAAWRVARRGLRNIGPQCAAGAIIAGYFPQDEEFDVMPLLERLRAGGHRVVLPVVVARRCPLVFRQWRQGEEPVPGAMGIPTPPATAPQLRPDIVLVPFLEADEHGYRLGYGGGYYDRTLAELRARGDVTAIGVGFADQIVAEVLHDRHDARLDAILTEKGLIHMPQNIDGTAR